MFEYFYDFMKFTDAANPSAGLIEVNAVLFAPALARHQQLGEDTTPATILFILL